jgi:hypothetical protein
MSEGLQTAFIITLDGTDEGDASKIWRDFVKEYGKIERDRRTKEYRLLDVIIPAVHDTMPISIIAKFDEYDELTRVNFWVKMDDRFINVSDDPDEMDKVAVLFDEYTTLVSKKIVEDELSSEEKILSKLEKDLSRLMDRHEDLHKDIEKARDLIRKAEAEIEENIREQEAKKTEILKQSTRVKEVSLKLNDIGRR